MPGMKEDKKEFVLAALKAGRYSCDKMGNVYSHKRGKTTKLVVSNNIGGYGILGIWTDGVSKTVYVHTVVALYFFKNIPPYMEVNHKNGIKMDNRLSNLELVTQSENTIHAYKTGLVKGPSGEKNGQHKLTLRDVIDIKYLLFLGANCGFQQKDIAAIFGVCRQTITLIKQSRKWAHV